MKRFLCFLMLSTLSLTPAVRAATPAVDPALTEERFLYEVLRHVYYWYLDDRFFVATAEKQSFELWIRPLEPNGLDEGDKSRFAEIWVPDAGLQLRLKKSDYYIPELDRRVRSPGYRITRAAALATAPHPAADYAVSTVDRDKARAYLFDTRNNPQVPDAALRARLRAALPEVLKLQPPPNPEEPQIFYVSTVTPVSGDLWVVWQNAKTAIRLGGELGAEEPDMLANLPLHTQLYDFRRQVVASLLEAEGSTGYITKDWAGRILFQCLVLGERVEIPPLGKNAP